MKPEPVAAPAMARLLNTDPSRLSRRHAIGLVILAACGCSPIAATDAPGGSTELFVWAWDVNKDADDFLAVVDVNRRSATYGQIVRTLPARGGRGAHHVEYEMTTGQLFANSFETGRTFIFDLGDPGHPRQLGEFGDVGAYSHPHSFARTPNGTVLGTFQGLASDHRAVGGLVEMDDHGKLIRAASAANRLDRDLRPYSLTIVPQLDRVVTTSADMHGMLIGRSVQVWRLSDLTLLHTLLLPPGPRGDEHLHPAEARVLADGKSVLVTTFRCGIYLLTELDGIPVARLTRSFPWSAVAGEDTDCNVPVRFGRFWIQPVGTTGAVVVLDVSNPERPVIVDELPFGVDARPHWLAIEPGGTRIPGIRFDRDEWPHGKTGSAFAHGAVFSPVN